MVFGDSRSARPYLQNFCVAPKWRRRGLGRVLLKMAERVVRDVWREDRIYLHAGSNEAAVQSQSSTLVVVSTCFNKSQQVSTIHFETTVVFESTNSLPGSFGPGATRLNNIGIEEERQKRNDVQHFFQHWYL
ncbi:unnamed protein product [Cladocopium goreaui]|uniref:N-acetyltransferase domain-containing protein n=1 Tax=Cladocopium goreaui TaxID=2562237 RepID=A0A9P1BW86_9DINO|nr:unnamed protein product [Cladocopium goreaui]